MISKPTRPQTLDVAIVGGGIGGLCLAIGLLKHAHINIQIYEAASTFSEIGAGVTVGPNARRALRLLSPGAEQAFLTQATGNGPDFPAQKNVFCRYVFGAGSRSGETIAEAWCDDGQQSVHRAHFLNELVKLVPEEIAHFTKRLVLGGVVEDEVSGKVKLRFEDGTMAEADCVIGADGVHSTVRKSLLDMDEDRVGYHPVFSHAAAYRGLIPTDEAKAVVGEEFTQIATLHCAPGGFIMTYPVDFHNLFNVVACDVDYKEWSGVVARQANLVEMKEKFSDWGPVAKNLVGLLDREETKIWSLWQTPPLGTFIKGRLAIIGDAAHATVPFHGQGAGQAIEDALVLSSLLARVESPSDLKQAFKAYDRIRRPRSQKVVRTSREAGDLFSLSMPGVLDDIDAFHDNIDDRFDWVFNRDMQLQVDQAHMMVEEMKIAEQRQK